jgi:hypothetical protein
VLERATDVEAKASRVHKNSNNCLIPPPRESPGRLFIEAIRGLTIMFELPLNFHVYTKHTITRVLYTFLAPKHFILCLSDYDTCPPSWGPSTDGP